MQNKLFPLLLGQNAPVRGRLVARQPVEVLHLVPVVDGPVEAGLAVVPLHSWDQFRENLENLSNMKIIYLVNLKLFSDQKDCRNIFWQNGVPERGSHSKVDR